MKVGIRTPNLKKRLKAKTTGKIKRSIKKTINPLYGKKGIGFIKNPSQSAYNHVYKKTTIDLFKPSTSNIWFWLFIGIWWYPIKWMFLLMYLGVKKLFVFLKKCKDGDVDEK